jgi:hypothetical protein
LSGTPNKRFALCVFIRTGGFPDEHHIGIRIADTKNRLRPASDKMRALEATTDASLNFSETGCFVRTWLDRAVWNLVEAFG